MKNTIAEALRNAGHNVVIAPDYTFAVPAGASVQALDAALADLDGIRIVRNGQQCSVAVELRLVLTQRELQLIGGE